ncbi:hypothetical protein GWU89_04545 [Salmonella enterica]|nr:hypothetical protein [Salmonella enterica]EEL8970829.1 hypothetical protein [Salmonella enterica]
MLYRKIRHPSSRNVVQAVSGPALADPQPAGVGFFYVPQPLAEYTGSPVFSGKP